MTAVSRDVLAKIPRETPRPRTYGGLRAWSLFGPQARETAVISEIDGVVRFGEVAKGQRKLYVAADNGTEKEYSFRAAFTSTCRKASASRRANRSWTGH